MKEYQDRSIYFDFRVFRHSVGVLCFRFGGGKEGEGRNEGPMKGLDC